MWRRRAWLAAALVGGAWVAGCSSDRPKPTPLQPLEGRGALRVQWQVRLSGITFPLGLSPVGSAIVLADDAGSVVSLDPASGREIWRAALGARLTAGVGSDGRWAAVVTRDNELVVVESGRERWRARLPARTLSTPFVAGERVFVMTVNRVVHAYDVRDGRRIWTFDRPGEALALGQPGVLAAFRDTLLVGQGPRLVGLDPMAGTVRWEATIGNPRGTNEVERLADLVGPPARVGTSFCARSFQSAVGCVDAQRGVLQWTRNVGGWQPVMASDQAVVATDASDRVQAWRAGSGESLWTQEKLMHRGLGAGALVGGLLAVGDQEGILHVLDAQTGSLVQRLTIDGTPFIAARQALAGTALLVTRGGTVLTVRHD